MIDAVRICHIAPASRDEAGTCCAVLRTLADEFPTHRDTCEAIIAGLERRLTGTSWSFTLSERVWALMKDRLLLAGCRVNEF